MVEGFLGGEVGVDCQRWEEWGGRGGAGNVRLEHSHAIATDHDMQT